MNYHKTNQVIKRRIDGGKTESLPALVVKVRPISSKKFEIILLHPNTGEVIYKKNHLARSINEALAIGGTLKKGKFAKIETWNEEILHVPRPKRGKMKLNTKEPGLDDVDCGPIPEEKDGDEDE